MGRQRRVHPTAVEAKAYTSMCANEIRALPSFLFGYTCLFPLLNLFVWLNPRLALLVMLEGEWTDRT